jgi:hypothetical protein
MLMHPKVARYLIFMVGRGLHELWSVGERGNNLPWYYCAVTSGGIAEEWAMPALSRPDGNPMVGSDGLQYARSSIFKCRIRNSIKIQIF